MSCSSTRLVRFVLFLLLAPAAVADALRPTGQVVDREVVVKFRPTASASEVSAVHKLADADQTQKLANLRSGALWRIRSRSQGTDAMTTALEKNPHVEYVELNFIVSLQTSPNDPSYGQLYGLKNTGQTIGGQAGVPGADIDAESAWSVTKGSSAIVIGVVDTGIDYNHPDLAANIWRNPGGKATPPAPPAHAGSTRSRARATRWTTTGTGRTSRGRSARSATMVEGSPA